MGAAFVKIPRLLLEQNSGPGAHRRYLLYGHIQSHCSAGGQGCWASIATLANALFLFTVSRLFSAWKAFLRVSSAMIVNDEQHDAMLKLLAGEMQLTLLRATSSERDANGV